MLNLECQTVYDIIRALAGEDDVYKIIEAEEILERVPKEISLSKVQLSAIIRELKEREYITVKYFTPDEYCLLVIKRIDERAKQQGAILDEEKPQEQTLSDAKSGKPQKIKSVSKGVVFLMSLLGSLIGSGIVAVVTVLIIKFV